MALYMISRGRKQMTTAQKKLEMVVIGSGPGGEGGAMSAAKGGASVTVVDKYEQVGGGCTHWATIPSKALRHSVSLLLDLRRNPLFAPMIEELNPNFPQLLQSARAVIGKQVAMRRDFYHRNYVPVVHGHARFINPHTIEVDLPDRPLRQINGSHFVIATGSRPYRPPDVDFTHPLIRDSDTILKLETTPQVLTIYGAGVVGCEYASIFRNLGVKVNLINSRD